MHSLMHRGNTVLTFFGTVAAALAILTACTDLFHASRPEINVSIAEIKRLYPHQNSKDQAVVTFNLEADLRSAFSWNTKQLFVFLRAEYLSDDGKLNQIVLWDTIIQQKEKAVIRLKKHKTKYAFIDHGNRLRNRAANLTLVWDVMPRVGYLAMKSHSVSVGTLPENYS